MPDTACWPSIRGEVMRVTKLDACGAVVFGPKSQLVTDGFVKISISPQYEDGEQTRLKKANGKIWLNDKADDEMVGFNVEANVTGVNPDLWNFFTGQPVILDHEGNAVGNRFDGDVAKSNFAIEVWSDIVGGDACAGGTQPFGYFVLPFLSGGKLSDFALEVAAADFTLTTATKENPLWGTGPHDVTLNPPVLPATKAAPGPLLTPFGPKGYFDMFQTLVPPPAIPANCGAFALTESP